MSNQKLSLEDILNEYSPEQNNEGSVREGRLETEKLLNSADKLSGNNQAPVPEETLSPRQRRNAQASESCQ